MPKLTYDEALDAINSEQHVDLSRVQPRALRRRVWCMLYSAPGCLPDYRAYCSTRQGAIDTARELYEDDAPRGFATRLRKYGIAAADAQGYYRVEIDDFSLSDILD